VATFHDNNRTAPVSDFTATITWGDGGTTTVSGSGGGIVSLGGGNFAVLGSHTYAEEGAVTISVQVLDVGGASATNSRGTTVADASLTGLKMQNPHATAGQNTGTFTVATFSDLNPGAPVSDFTATVSWGDGSSSTLSGAGGGIVEETAGTFALLSSHTYGAAGTYTLSVQVLDVGNASIAGNLKVVVNAP
jgi:hypothetical protein